MSKSSMRTVCSRWLAIGLSYLLMLPGAGPVAAQEASSIEIIVDTGMNRINSADNIASWEIAVHVQDKRGRRIPGATVFFQLAPGAGVFATGGTTLMLTTDDNGRAVAHGLKSGRSGSSDIVVTASYHGMSATVLVPQITKPPIFFTPAKLAIIGGAAAATGLGLWLGLRNTNNSTKISLGTGAVGPAGQQR
jgi:hypothetical protein